MIFYKLFRKKSIDISLLLCLILIGCTTNNITIDVEPTNNNTVPSTMVSKNALAMVTESSPTLVPTVTQQTNDTYKTNAEIVVTQAPEMEVEEVVQEGNEQQKKEAEELLAQI